MSQEELIGANFSSVYSTYPPCQQESRAVGSSIVSQTDFEAIVRQLVRIRCSHYDVPVNTSISNLQRREGG